MGIYRNEAYAVDVSRDGEHQILVKTIDAGYGLIRTEVYQLICSIDDRQTCFCCSCGYREGADVACRNHGFAAMRPCEKHGMPGMPWGEEMCDDLELHQKQDADHLMACSMDKMPESVEQANKKNS